MPECSISTTSPPSLLEYRSQAFHCILSVDSISFQLLGRLDAVVVAKLLPEHKMRSLIMKRYKVNAKRWSVFE